MDFLEGLNPQQREAVECVDGPVLILAGAGSGKTRVITHRIAHLIRAHHVPPYAVMAVTFTNKAAREMRDRVGTLLGDGVPPASLTVATFHSFCVRLLRRDGQSLADLRPGFTRNFQIYDEDAQIAIVKAVYKELGLTERRSWPTGRLFPSSATPRTGVRRRGLLQVRQGCARETAGQRVRAVRKRAACRPTRWISTICCSRRCVCCGTMRPMREATTGASTYLMVDEYQDTNRTQYELMRLLSIAHPNVCVVGDEDQSIYSWRGADIHNILDFEQDYPERAGDPAGAELPLHEEDSGSGGRGGGE